MTDLQTDGVIVVDMQVGLHDSDPKHDLAGVIGRINAVTAAVRRRGGAVIWIRHCGKPGDGFEPGTAGWELLPEPERHAGGVVVDKTLNDAFAERRCRKPWRVSVLPACWCVARPPTSASTARFARPFHTGYQVVIVADAHMLADRPHLDAVSVIRHHNWVWSGLITSLPVRVAPAAELVG